MDKKKILELFGRYLSFDSSASDELFDYKIDNIEFSPDVGEVFVTVRKTSKVTSARESHRIKFNFGVKYERQRNKVL